MRKYFPSMKCVKYDFISEDVRDKYQRIACTPRPALVLTELRHILGTIYDVSQLDCVPRSKFHPDMLFEPCKKYDKGGRMPAVHWTELRRAASNVKGLLSRKRRIKPLDLEDVPFDGSKNSGLPYLAKKRDVITETMERAKRCEMGACPPPMIMFSRGKNLDVARPVLCGPFEWQLVEGKFFYPLQEYLLTFDNPYLVGRHACTVAAKVDELGNYPYVLAMDYSGYDGSLSSWIINAAFSILHSCLSLTEDEERQWKAIVSYFVTCPIVCPDLRLYRGKRHGVPSGSMFTQMIDSVANMIIIEYVSLRLHYDKGHYYVVGDDSLVSFETRPSVSDIVRIASEIGITVHPKKSEVYDTSRTNSFHFLGHTYEYGLPDRCDTETLARLLTPERIDRRVFSKKREIRDQYYIERIRAYQEDAINPESFWILRLLETRLKFPNVDESIVRLQTTALDRYRFGPAEIVERERWDHNRRELRNDPTGRSPRSAVYWA